MKLTRRELLKLGAGTGVGLALGWRPAWARVRPGQEADLITKPIPSSGEELPVVGIGMRNYRTEWIEEPGRYRETIRVFHELGGKVLDTAPGYGDSESVLGGILEELGIRNDLFIATKVDREGRDAGVQRMEASLEKIGTDHVDLMQVHNLRGAREVLPAMREWKEAGRIRYIGVTTSSDRQYEGLEEIMESEYLDFVQVDYSLGNRSAAERILPLAADRGMGALINLPFGRGRMFEAVGDRPLPDWAGEIGCETWAQVFLKYVVSHPAVTVAIPGTTEPGHARDNVGAALGTLPDAELRRRMERWFDAL